MKTAKPQSMAAQTDAPDDLIAELARLMADDARSDQTPRVREPAPEKPAPVRIPGSEAAQEPEPFFGSVRIPGGAKATEPEPFNFDFAFEPKRDKAAPVSPVPVRTEAPASVAPVTPQPAPAPEPVLAATPLDQDGLADLIAAELANDLATPVQPIPAAPGPARGEDNFNVPPVFGLGAPAAPRPAAAAPVVSARAPESVAEVAESEPTLDPAPAEAPVTPDPLADIERLIAPVVQKAQQDAEVPRAPSPALRSLATPTLPVMEAQVPPRSQAPRIQAGSVDDAILAAAAATGARVEWVNPELDHQDVEPDTGANVPPAARRSLRLSRAVVGPLVALLLLGVAGGGLYWVLGQGDAPSGPAPLLVADTTAVKEVPEPAEPTTQQSIVFNEISGAGNAADEQIVPRDQADQAAIDEAAASTGGSGILTSGDGTGIDPNQEGLVNRKVRTVTVRPDGTIISGSDSMAGSAILPVERPNVPEVPGADFSTPDLIASTINAAETATATTSAPETTPAPETTTPAVTPVTPGSVVPVVNAEGNALAGRTVSIPSSRPNDFAQAAASALAASAVPATASENVLAAPSAQAPAATPTVSDTTSGAAAFVQLASQRSEEAARQSAQAMNTRYGVLFSGAAPEIQRVDLGERGIYYRVLVPAASRDAAANICTNIRAAGGDCLLP